ncbi:Ti-type conjugative transfer relaxase TraA [Rhizobium leguminosarum]|uniref:Ti-type conjugative transfer relaxase TraA n=1 Tax=Rhizobium leguminosarum TaxID=384 RepID=UPI0015F7D562|nr:Ti-type conjugative transfer relaxase TraA [Rhizobium leguminosarum]MBA9031752.1 Ti-type conjugative transfer relaxase TraA [Rhizobium leguminosarum]
MAIFYAQMSPVSRSSGRSAVAAIAYRAAEKLTNERDGLTHDYRNKQGVEHSEIVLPEGVNADWAKDRSQLWNAVEKREVRKDARVAREFVLALPHELSVERRLALTREFAQGLADRYGAAVDFSIHQPHTMGDVRNHHAHVMMATRQVTNEGLGAKTYLELANKELLPRDLPTTQMQLVDIRRSWEQMANRELAQAGLDIRIDHRSHSERGLEIEPTEHMGVRATNVQRRGGEVDRTRIDAEAAKRNADLIRNKPEQVLTLISNEKSVFDRHDVARTLHRYINGDPKDFQNAFASVMASTALVELQSERVDAATGEIELARYSTREMVDLENGIVMSAGRLHQAHGHGVDCRHVSQAFGRQDDAIRSGVASDTAGKLERGEIDIGERDRRLEAARLSDEQRAAIAHITGPERIAAVVGYAGAGKSTMLAAAREAWEAQGFKVHGAALSGKAAQGLEESSGIASRTLASWEYNWQAEKRTLGRGDVLVVDEAGMVGSRQLARFVNAVEKSGAKIVLVGDHEQLQAIGAGAPFRAIAAQIGHAELSEILRQNEPWQREASVAFATHRTAEGLAAYQAHGDIRLGATREDVRAGIVRDYLADREQRPEGSRVAMAHRRADVFAINDAVRTALQDRFGLARGAENGEFTFQTDNGKRAFAPGDRIVFLQNDRDLGVKNGMMGTVAAVEPDALQIRLDGKAGGVKDAHDVTVRPKDYQSFDHGYATTIHKNQGATVDRAFVMASGTMDRHLTYVAMTRHRDAVQLYAAQDEFADRKAGRLIEHGPAPYEHKAGNRDSYFVTLENDKGQKHTTWGVDLDRAMTDAKPDIGAKIGLEHAGSETVRLPDGTTAERNSWKVHSADALAFKALEDRLSRSGVKETTLDYTRDFAERRGMAEQFGIKSEIELSPTQNLSQDMSSRAAHPAQELQDRPSTDRSADEERGRPQAGPDRRREEYPVQDLGRTAQRRDMTEPSLQKAPAQKRSMFAGLKLNVGRRAAQERELAPDRQQPVREVVSERDHFADRIRPLSGFEQAVDQYARTFSAADKHLGQGLPLLDVQKHELATAGQKLDQARPGSHELIRSALQHDPKVGQAMTELSGRERVGQLVAGMDRERAALADPNVRADRFVQRWHDLQGQRQELRGRQHDEARGKIEGQMRGMAKGLDRDPQLETALRNRSQELGISHIRQGQTIAREMERQVSQSHSQRLKLER